MRLRYGLLFSLLLCPGLIPATAQSRGGDDIVSRAFVLSSEQQFPAVVALLTPYVQAHPEQGEAWLLLAQHQYWSKDIPGARSTFEAALRHHPDLPDLRLAYAQFLMENRDLGKAEHVLEPLGDENADAEVIRGTIAWWTGNTSEAARRFRSALRTRPDHGEAASGLASIRAESRPWVRVAGQAGTDNQPMTRYDTSVETGFFITPLQTLRAEITHARFDLEGAIHPATFVAAAHRSFWPALNLETDIAAGVTSRLDSTYWSGHVDAGVRLSYGFRAGARFERLTYLYTLASITESVMLSAVQARITTDRAGWQGEVAVRREYFPDDNTKNAAYGWLLAPILRNNWFTFQAGYAYSYQHAEEHRLTPVLVSAPAPGRPPVWEGRYIPYYTPVNLQTHSVTGNFVLQLSRKVTFTTHGAYGFYGFEDAPFVYVDGQAPRTGLYDHTIRPWNLRSSLSFAISPSITLQGEGATMETSWYDVSTFNLALYARF